MSIPKALGAAAAGVASATLVHQTGTARRQNSPFRRYWERHLIATVRELDLRSRNGGQLPLIYVALGDSAAQGLGAKIIVEGYVPIVAKALAEMTGREVALLNLSLSGGTVQSVLGTQISQLSGLRIAGEPIVPDVVTLDIGSNDVGQTWVSADSFERDYRSMAQLLPSGSFVLNIPSFGILPAEARAAAFSQIIESQLRAHGHHLVDIRTTSKNMPLSTYMFKFHAADMFHPNSRWYEVWAQKFVDKISAVHNCEPIEVAHLDPWSGPISHEYLNG